MAASRGSCARGELGGRPGRVRRTAKGLAAGVAWVVLLFFVLFAGFLVAGAVLSLVVLHTVPGGTVLVIVGIGVALVGLLSWAVARFVASPRTVRRVLAATCVSLLVGGTVWAFADRIDSLYLARAVAILESGVRDYEVFPAQRVENAASVYHYAKRPSPDLFRTIRYDADGQVKHAPFDEFMRSSDTTAFIVIKDDAILYERYFNGWKRDSWFRSFSTAKSFTSAMVGIAIEEGYIGGVDDRLVKYLPELKGRGYDDITIRDLLTMSTGIRYAIGDDAGILQPDFPYTFLNPYADDTAAYRYPDIRKLLRTLPASKEPVGAAYWYNDYYPLLLGMVLERATGQPVSQYFQEKIWKPLGAEFPATWSLDSTQSRFPKIEAGLNARAIDFAKFGSLFLHQGRWNGRQVVPKAWVAESTSRDRTDHRPWLLEQEFKAAGGYYKYMWWGEPRLGRGDFYFATGHLGQKIAVFPQDGVVIARFGIDDAGVDSWDDVIRHIEAKVR